MCLFVNTTVVCCRCGSRTVGPSGASRSARSRNASAKSTRSSGCRVSRTAAPRTRLETRLLVGSCSGRSTSATSPRMSRSHEKSSRAENFQEWKIKDITRWKAHSYMLQRNRENATHTSWLHKITEVCSCFSDCYFVISMCLFHPRASFFCIYLNSFFYQRLLLQYILKLGFYSPK